MGSKNLNARKMVYNKILPIPTTKSILRIVDSSKNIRFRGEGLINPSVGKLSAWADPFKGVKVVKGVSY